MIDLFSAAKTLVAVTAFTGAIAVHQPMTSPDQAMDGICHIYYGSTEQYTFQLPESACAYNVATLNEGDPTSSYWYVWNPIG